MGRKERPKGMKVEDVTPDFIKAATAAFLSHRHVGRKKPEDDKIGWYEKAYCEQAAEDFMKLLKDEDDRCEGFRFGVVGWGHTKWRFRVDRFGDGLFRFYVHANVDKEHEKDVMRKCREIAQDLTKARFPTEAGP